MEIILNAITKSYFDLTVREDTKLWYTIFCYFEDDHTRYVKDSKTHEIFAGFDVVAQSIENNYKFSNIGFISVFSENEIVIEMELKVNRHSYMRHFTVWSISQEMAESFLTMYMVCCDNEGT